MSKKRGNNDGSIRQRKDGLWEARYVAGYASNGKAIRRSLYAKTQAEVQTKLREALRQLERGEYCEPSRMTVGQWLETWYSVYGLPRWRGKTAEVHLDNVRLHLIPSLGKVQLAKLRPDNVQAFVNAQSEAGFSPASIRKQLEPLKGALKQAVDNQLILRNPADNVKLPQMEQKEIEFLTVDEQKALLPCLPDTTAGRALRFILGTGLRASELCGLRWSDVGQDCFTVRQSAQYIRKAQIEEGESKQTLSIAPPKTKAGRREIPLTDGMRALIERQRFTQMQARLSAGSAWVGQAAGKGEAPVFASEIGTVLDRNNLARVLRLCLHNAGLKSRGIHALRHTFATNWVRSGGDLRTLSEVLGHTKVAFTMQLYVHSDMSTKREGMRAVEGLF